MSAQIYHFPQKLDFSQSPIEVAIFLSRADDFIERLEQAVLDRNFEMPINMKPHVEKVFQGEYALHKDAKPTRIMDLGANCGAFTVWAKTIWPEAEIFAFEPLEFNFDLLLKNVDGLSGVECFNQAVGDPALSKIYKGKNNSGECSQYLGHEQSEVAEDIYVCDAKDEWFQNLVASVDFVKIDIEGAEKYLVPNVPWKARYIALEYHGEENRMIVENTFYKFGYTLVHCNVTDAGYGILKYEKNPG
jgi:FkbM family methyltransferase